MQPAAPAAGAVDDAARFEDASETDEAAQKGAPTASACERADGGGDVGEAAAWQEDDFSDDEDETMLAEALDWDFCEGALARGRARPCVSRRLSDRGCGAADFRMRDGSVSVCLNSWHPNAHGGLAHRAAGACATCGQRHGFAPPAHPAAAARLRSSAAAREAHAAVRGPHQRCARVEGVARALRVRKRRLRRALTCGCLPLLQRDALDVSDSVSLPGAVATSVRESARRESAGRVRHVEKADRATVEQALDPRTRLVRDYARSHRRQHVLTRLVQNRAGLVQDAQPGCIQLDQRVHLHRQGGKRVSRCHR